MLFKRGALKNFANSKGKHLICCNFIKLYSDWVLNTPLYYLLAKVHIECQQTIYKVFSFVTLSDNSKILNVLHYPNRFTIERDK